MISHKLLKKNHNITQIVYVYRYCFQLTTILDQNIRSTDSLNNRLFFEHSRTPMEAKSSGLSRQTEIN